MRRFALCLMALASTCAALAAVEAGFRFFAPQATKVSVPVVLDQDLIYRLPPNASGTDVKEEFAVRIETNSEGLRDRDYPPAKPPGVRRRILVLGDSMTFAEGVEAEETYPKVLERALAERYGVGRYEVINAAVRGYGNDQELVLFERIAPIYRPDLVLLAFFAVNDPDDNLYGGVFRLDGGRLVRVPLSQAASPKYRYYLRQARIQTFPGYRFLIQHSHTINFVRHRWAQWEFVREFGAPAALDPDREERAWQLSRAILTEWAMSARRRGVRPLMLLIPSPRQATEGRDALIDARTERVLGLATEIGVPAFDPRPALRVARAGSTALYYPKDAHMTAQGHRVVAAFLEECLEAAGLVR